MWQWVFFLLRIPDGWPLASLLTFLRQLAADFRISGDWRDYFPSKARCLASLLILPRSTPFLSSMSPFRPGRPTLCLLVVIRQHALGWPEGTPGASLPSLCPCGASCPGLAWPSPSSPDRGSSPPDTVPAWVPVLFSSARLSPPSELPDSLEKRGPFLLASLLRLHLETALSPGWPTRRTTSAIAIWNSGHRKSLSIPCVCWAACLQQHGLGPLSGICTGTWALALP